VVRYLSILPDYEEEEKMPKHKSAKKRVKTNLKRQTRNRAAKSALKSTLKTLRAMPQDQKEEQVRQIQSVLDQAVGAGIVHRNKAARLKSRSTRKAKSKG
jgi:small subunit ribosomal protein S20